jgi:hypothetical protein
VPTFASSTNFVLFLEGEDVNGPWGERCRCEHQQRWDLADGLFGPGPQVRGGRLTRVGVARPHVA